MDCKKCNKIMDVKVIYDNHSAITYFKCKCGLVQ